MPLKDVPVFDVQVTQDEWNWAWDELEETLEDKVWTIDLDDFKGMAEQVVGERR